MQYFVAGLPRTGTTWMMMCLEAGGMTVNAKTPRYETYIPLNRETPETLENCVTKIFMDQTDDFNFGGTTIVCMHRDPVQVLASQLRMKYGGDHPWIISGEYDQKFWEFVNRWKESANVSVCNLSVIELGVERQFFNYLSTKGWPINPFHAAEVKNPDRRYANSKN